MHVGTAAWAIPRSEAAAFPGEGHQLQRYARVLGCTEINSSFYRSHRVEVYQRWAALTPADFRFAVKLPRTITHAGRLRRAREPLGRFLAEVAGLGGKLGVLLVQLPPSLVFEARVVKNFFALLRDEGFMGSVVVEPRHASWFGAAADRLLLGARVGRAAADPALCDAARVPGGWLGPAGDGRGAVLYHRWHGSPRMYWSGYPPTWLETQAAALRRQWPADAGHWCIFDNTAAGRALPDAQAFQALLEGWAGTPGNGICPDRAMRPGQGPAGDRPRRAARTGPSTPTPAGQLDP